MAWKSRTQNEQAGGLETKRFGIKAWSFWNEPKIFISLESLPKDPHCRGCSQSSGRWDDSPWGSLLASFLQWSMSKDTQGAPELMIKPMYEIHDMDSVLSRWAWPLSLLCGLLTSKLCKLYLLIWYLEGPTKNSMWWVDNIGPIPPRGSSGLSYLEQTLWIWICFSWGPCSVSTTIHGLTECLIHCHSIVSKRNHFTTNEFHWLYHVPHGPEATDLVEGKVNQLG